MSTYDATLIGQRTPRKLLFCETLLRPGDTASARDQRTRLFHTKFRIRAESPPVVALRAGRKMRPASRILRANEPIECCVLSFLR